MFIETPRYFGFPIQTYVRSKEGLANLVDALNGRAPCFVSVLRYPQPLQPVFNKFVFDLDSDDLNKTLDDVKKLREFAKSIRAKYTVVFSGRKGFHFYIHCKPSVITSHFLGKVHAFIAESCKLTTADPHIFGDLRRVIRLPTSRYVSRDGHVNGHYCRHITDTDIDKGIDHILELSEQPGKIPKTPTVDYTFAELTHRLRSFTYVVKEMADTKRVRFATSAESGAITDLDVVVPRCLRHHITDYNPTHIIRFEATCWLKLCKFSKTRIIDFYEQLEWRDWNQRTTNYQTNRARPRPPDCNKLKQSLGEGYCEECSLGGRRVLH